MVLGQASFLSTDFVIDQITFMHPLWIDLNEFKILEQRENLIALQSSDAEVGQTGC